jgi:spore coat protein H
LNGRSLGLYVLKEGFTEAFLARHFGRADGNLYDTDLGHDVNLPMKRRLGRDSATKQTDLQRLAAAAIESDLSCRWQSLQQSLDIDGFLSFMAMEIMICHWDGYCLGQNNFRIYHDPGTDRIFFLPSGMDQLFSKADLTWKPDMAGLVARAITEVPEGRQLYAARFRSLLAALFVSERLTNRVNQLVAELRPFLKNAAFKEMRREAADLCVRIAEREINLKKQLSEPEPSIPEFENTAASLTGWKAFNEPGGGKTRESYGSDGQPAFQIVADSSTSASWRTTVRLNRGRYRFRGHARVIDVTPLAFGKSQGASLRVAGKPQRSANLTGTSAWTTLEADFEVSRAEEEVVLVCELRAGAGEVCFKKGSLVLLRLQ